MTGEDIVCYQAESIYPLPFFSVESLYYHADVLGAVAKRQAATYEADEEKQAELTVGYLADVVAEGIAAAAKQGVAEHLAGRLAERQVRDALLSQMPKRSELVSTASTTIQICELLPDPWTDFQLS